MNSKEISKILESQRTVYRNRFLQFGDRPEGFFWNDRETQQLRFRKIVSEILEYWPPGNSFTVHEIGCGTADLHEYLLQRNVKHEYSGTEIVHEMCQAALDKYPDIRIIEQNLFEQTIENQYDFVVMSGPFNLRTSHPKDWNRYIQKMLRKAFSLCRCGMAFNFLTSNITIPPVKHLHYINPKTMFEFCRTKLSRFLTLSQSYPLYEVTITVFQMEYIRRTWDSSLYDKYFRTP